ncbi:CAP-Gly domain-containing linker protein 1-like [Ylistrum balloti]|uniref:CAP-Gly domain-containing linker protein 1-like n=1 Tax=Ylistrum balloti TaxID=509963 RepID=UPI002905D593|nr:CAP-Gly domain-containing linker protein 1-like [Ylistrum balloti]
MGVIFSSQYLTSVNNTVKIAQTNIARQRSHGDAALLQLQNIKKQLDNLKLEIYFKVCSGCKSTVKEILGETPPVKRNLTDILPPERQMLLREMVHSMIELQLSKSGHTDASDTEVDEALVDEALAVFDVGRYTELEELLRATTEKSQQNDKSYADNILKAHFETDTILLSKLALEKELNEMKNKIEDLLVERDKQTAQIEELEIVVKSRTNEGYQLKTENTRLKNANIVLQATLDSQIKALAHMKETTDFQTACDKEKNRQVQMATYETDKENEYGNHTHTEIRQGDGEQRSTVNERQKREIDKIQSDPVALMVKMLLFVYEGKQVEQLQTAQEKTSTAIQELREAKHIPEEENAKHLKEMTSSTEQEKILEKQCEDLKGELEKSETTLVHLKVEQQNMKHQRGEENARYAKEISRLEENEITLQRQCKNLQEELEQSEVSLARMKMDYDKMQESFQNRMKKMEEKHANTSKDLLNSTQEIDRLKTLLNTLEYEIETVNEKFTSMFKTKNEIEMASERLEREKKEMEDALNKELRQLKNENTSNINEMANVAEENTVLKRTLTTLESQNATLNEKIAIMYQAQTELEIDSKKMQEMKDSMNEQMKHLQDENSSLVKEMANSIEEIQNLKRTLGSVSQSRDELEKDVKILEVEKKEVSERLNEQVTQLQEMTEKLSSSGDLLQKENAKLKEDLGTADQRLRSAGGEIEKCRDYNQQLENEVVLYVAEINNFSTEITELKTNLSESDILICRLQKERTTLSDSKDHFESLVHNLQAEREDIREELTKQMTDKPEEKEDIFSVISGLNCYVDKLQFELRTKSQNLESALAELEEIKNRRKSVVMGLRVERSGLGKTMIDLVSKELTKRLQKCLEKERIDIDIKLCQTRDDVPHVPLFVLCLNMSRVGTNIREAIEGIKPNRDVYALVLHNTVKENLLLLTPTGHRVTGQDLRQLGGIIDMALTSDSGLYECDLNETAVDKMAAILKRYSQ